MTFKNVREYQLKQQIHASWMAYSAEGKCNILLVKVTRGSVTDFPLFGIV